MARLFTPNALNSPYPNPCLIKTSSADGYSKIVTYAWPMIRLSELYLNYAEAINESNGPNDIIFVEQNQPIRTFFHRYDPMLDITKPVLTLLRAEESSIWAKLVALRQLLHNCSSIN